jgi:hypothetical protein
VNGNYYIDLKENCNRFNACTIYYFVLNLLLGKSGTDKMSEKMTAFDHVKNGFFKNPHPPENPRIRGLKILLLRTSLITKGELIKDTLKIPTKGEFFYIRTGTNYKGGTTEVWLGVALNQHTFVLRPVLNRRIFASSELRIRVVPGFC